MKTPKQYNDNLKCGVLTEEMIGACIYSFNKRAKNYRDKRNQYRKRYYYDRYGNIDKFDEKSKYFYSLKEKMLSYYTPIELHRQNFGNRIRVYSYEDRYKDISNNEDKYNIVWSNYYIDDDIPVYFYDIIEGINYKYFKYYEIGGFKFHQPLSENESYKKISRKYNLSLKDLDDDFYTEGAEIQELLSLQCCMKIYNLFISTYNI